MSQRDWSYTPALPPWFLEEALRRRTGHLALRHLARRLDVSPALLRDCLDGVVQLRPQFFRRVVLTLRRHPRWQPTPPDAVVASRLLRGM